jgi:poly(A) polymerase
VPGCLSGLSRSILSNIVSVIPLDAPRNSAEEAVAMLIRVPSVADELGRRFEAAGATLHLVGGSVRDALLGRSGADGNGTPPDLDFATDARPEQVLEIAAGWAEATWTAGIAFGTVGLSRRGTRLEITTYRSEAYDRTSRNPTISYGETLEEDLARRDFTVNAMAVSVPGHDFVDLFGGLADLGRKVLRTPGAATASFDDDPLRMLRAARFVAQLGLSPVPEVVEAMTARADRLAIVSAERIRDELVKLMLAPDPVAGLSLLVDTGVAANVIPELPGLRLEIDEHHQHKDVYAHTLRVLERAIDREPDGPDLVLRLAALLHDIGKPRTRAHTSGGGVSFHHHEVVGAKMTRKRLAALRFPKPIIEATTRLVELHLRFHGYAGGEWTDSAVRRYVTDAGPYLDQLHRLVRSDCTTRNRRKAAMLDRAYDDLEDRIARLRKQEELDAIRPDLDGNEVIGLLGVRPGPVVGKALAHLLSLRMEYGPLGHDRAVQELRAWAREQGIEPVD